MRLIKKNLELIEKLKSEEFIREKKEERPNKILLKEILTSIKEANRGIIIAGPTQYDEQEKTYLIKLSEELNFPILADASSQLRFGRKLQNNLIVNYEEFLSNKHFINKIPPDLILQFGRTTSSKAIEIFLDHINPKRYIINKYGDLFDPWNSSTGVLKCTPSLFYKLAAEVINRKKKSNDNWIKDYLRAENLSQKIKEKLIISSSFPNECRIIPEVINALPENVHLMISNSMPVRDFDYFAPVSNKEIVVHTNRGASGIDGIISTTLGIQKVIQKPSLLITGDLAFYYDINSLLTADKYKIPLVIVLVNNNGGGIFSTLPVSKYGNKFTEFFISPHNLNFESIVCSFNGRYKIIKSWDDLNKSIHEAFTENTFTVLEIKTKIKTSVYLRNKFFKEANKIISKNFS